jgi:hypothetical protein
VREGQQNKAAIRTPDRRLRALASSALDDLGGFTRS